MILLVILQLVGGIIFSEMPNFPMVGKDYSYNLTFPENTDEIIIIWYYAIERKENIIHSTDIVSIRCCVVKTDMYFYRQGLYIQRVMWNLKGNRNKVYTWRKKYTVRNQ